MPKFLLSIVFLLTIGILRSQAPFGEFIDYKLLPNLDTLVLKRSYGDWWFGSFATISWNINFGKLQIPERPFLPLNDTINRLLLFDSKNSVNMAGGISIEYIPKGFKWAGMCRLTLLEGRASESIAKLTEENKYSALFDFRTIVFSPSLRYNFKIEGLHAFAGFDIELLYKDYSKLQQTEIKDGARIITDWVLPAGVRSMRFGMHLGAGWEFLFLNIGHSYRARWRPFISLNYGTNFFSGYNSSLNTFFIRGGIALTFAKDQIQEDLRKYDSTYSPPPTYTISRTSKRRGVYYPGINEQRIFASLEIGSVDISRIFGELSIEKDQPIQAEAGMTEKKQSILINPNEKLIVQDYAKAEIVSLTNSTKAILNAVAEFLIANPLYIVAIEGHSDNQGTPAQNLERSQMRARIARDYLISRGINPNRIRWAGRSSFVPIADNTTETGRRLNRRIEILLVK